MPKRSKKRGKMELDEAAAAGDDAMSTRSAAGSQSSELSVDRLAEFEDFDPTEKGDLDDRSTQEIFEDKLKEAIDGVLEKSLRGRMNSIKSIIQALRKRVLSDFLHERHLTVFDALERCLKKGKGEEQALAARALVLLCVQLGLTEEGEAVFSNMQSTLISLLQDPSASLLARAACAEAVGLCGFISTSDLEIVSQLMSLLETVFSKSYLKGDKTTPTLSPQTCALHRSALESWSLLFSIATPSLVRAHIDKVLPKLPELLESVDLDLRIASGETIALVYELARDQDEDFEGTNIDSLCDKLRQLSTDNNKHQTKKDRKQQRSSFRDVLHSIEDGTFREIECKFGTECVLIDSWARKRQYDALCAQLESGTNAHLQDNMLLREIFGLGAPIPSGTPQQKASKNDRRLYNQAAFKARTLSRQKQRDKRTAKLSY